MPELTPTEQQALIDSLQHSFGACTCRTVNGQVMFCDGHRFIAETQTWAGELMDRVSILLAYRRMASFWTSAEFSRPFTTLQPEPMLQPAPIPEEYLKDIPGSPQQGDAPERLPW